MALKGLIILAADWTSGQKAEQQRTGTTVADDSDIVRISKPLYRFKTFHDALLHIDGPLPAVNTCFGCGKELVGYSLVLFGGQEASGASVDLVKAAVGQRTDS